MKCEGRPEGPGISDAQSGGEYDWGYAHYTIEWWNESCCNCIKRREAEDHEELDDIAPLKRRIEAQNRTLVPGETHEHKMRFVNGTIVTTERYTILEDGSLKDAM
jgi:hypothetical protein